MRAIDADRLIDDLKHDVAMDQDSLDYEELTDSNREKIQFDKDCKRNAIDLLQNAPTIEPERKKGKWNTYYHSDIDFSHSCNQCGYSAPYQMIGGEVFQKKWNFCPNCGVDMREDQDDQSKR